MVDNKTLDSVFNLVHSLKRYMHEQIENIDIPLAPMQVRVMKILSRKKIATAIDIANFLDRDKAQVTRMLKPMIEQGLIVKQPNPEDKRSQRLVLTDKGQAMIEQIRQLDGGMLETMCQGLSEQEIEHFQAVSKRMTSNLNQRKRAE
ncbi:MarR family winged helix-turn-helix transcriptional regulator [Vibrio sp. WXL103]|uniref:MarR family winged helix-turn-helix transcriptional regulator n=1 Tax=unclassified Vibrio TaxID=2614977 RepID=UPI003EC81F65